VSTPAQELRSVSGRENRGASIAAERRASAMNIWQPRMPNGSAGRGLVAYRISSVASVASVAAGGAAASSVR
jgi:hypothetical protein